MTSATASIPTIRLEIVVAATETCSVSITRRVRVRRALASFAGIVFAMNLVLAVGLETGPAQWRDPEYGLRLNSLRKKRAEFPERPLIVVLGSSRTAMGIRPDVYEASLSEPTEAPLLFNLSMAGAGPILQEMMLERLLADGIRPAAILLEFWPALLRGDGLYREERRIEVERLRPSDRPLVEAYFSDPEETRSKILQSQAFPLWYHRRDFLLRVWPEAIPWNERADGSWSTLDSWGWLPGRKTVTAEQVERGWPHVVGFYAPLFQTYAIAPVADRALRSCLRRAREAEIAVSLIALPESTRFHALMTAESIRLAEEYRMQLVRECDVPFIEGRNWGSDAALPDGFHLMQDGATRFTRELAGHLAPQK